METWFRFLSIYNRIDTLYLVIDIIEGGYIENRCWNQWSEWSIYRC